MAGGGDASMDLMEQVAAEMEEVHRVRRHRWRVQQAYHRFRARRPWRWLPRALRARAFRLFGIPPELKDMAQSKETARG